MHIARLVSRLFKLFIPSIIEKIAKSSGFMKCHSKLLPEAFAKAFSTIYTNALESRSSYLLKYFSDVKLLDSTTISLPDQVAGDYVGMGGRNAKAALKIQTLYSAVSHSITHFDITSGVTHDTSVLPEMIEALSEEAAHKRIKKAVIQNGGNDISNNKREILHWNLMITNISADVLDTTIITELYRMRWQIELLFKVLKSTFSIDKMHVAKTRYVESILYGRLIEVLMTMPLYDCVDQTLLCSKGRGVSIQRFYILLSTDLYQFYAIKKVTLHTYSRFCEILLRIGCLAQYEKRIRQTTYSRIESYLEELLQFGKT